MDKIKSFVRSWIPGAPSLAICLAMCLAMVLAVISLVAGAPVRAEGEKRTVFDPADFHWQGSLQAGQTLEVVNTNGEIGASRASGDASRVAGVPGGNEDDKQMFIEVVEYADGVAVCAVYAKERRRATAIAAECRRISAAALTTIARRSTLTCKCRAACSSTRKPPMARCIARTWRAWCRRPRRTATWKSPPASGPRRRPPTVACASPWAMPSGAASWNSRPRMAVWP